MLNSKVKTKAKPGSGFMDLSNVESLLSTQSDTTARRQTEEVKKTAAQQAIESESRRQANIVRDQAQVSSSGIQEQQLEILNGIHGQITKANEAMRLADSDNPMDRLSLWFLQSQDPSYTREGNLARIQYLQQAAGAVGDINVIQQQGFNEQINAIQADMEDSLAGVDDRLELLKLSEAQGQELIDAEVAAMNTRAGIMQTQRSMQESALVNLTDDQVEKAAQQAAASPNQIANIGGIDVPLAALQDRQRIVKERRYNEQVMQTNAAQLALGKMDVTAVAQLQQQASTATNRAVVVDGVEIPLGQIEDRLFNLNNQQFTTTQQQASLLETREQLLLKSQDKILADLSTIELQNMINNGYKDINQVPFDPARVQYFRDARNENDTQMAQQGALAASSQPTAIAASIQSQIATVQTNLPPASPALVELNNSRSAVAHATQVIATATNPAQAQVGHALLQAAQESVTATITAEAKRLSDNDADLETAYKYVLTGQAIPVDQIEGVMANAAKKGLPVGRWLTGEHNALFKTTYHNTLAAMEADITGNAMLDSDSKKQLALQEASSAVMQAIANPLSDQIMIAQVNYPSNPLRGVIRPDEFANMMRTADDQGLRAYAEVTGKSEEEMLALRTGQVSDPTLVAKQNSMLFQALERKRPGLGQAYVDWWASPDRTAFVSNVLNQNLQAAAGDFTRTAELSLIMPQVQAAMGAQSNFLAEGLADSYASDIAAQHANFVAFGNNPQAKQVFLLEQTPNLTTQEKQIGMQQVIQPLLDEAAQNGAKSVHEVTMYVETRLRTFEPPTPQASRVLTKLLSGRDSAIKVVDDFITVNTGWNRIGNQEAIGNVQSNGLSADFGRNVQPLGYQWYTDLVSGGGISPTSPVRMNQGMN